MARVAALSVYTDFRVSSAYNAAADHTLGGEVRGSTSSYELDVVPG